MNSPNILLYTIDALRFDAAFQLTALSGEKWSFFRNHYGVAHCSDPNYLSILTGWSPDAIKELYGVEVYTQMGSQFKKVFPTLPVALKKLRGYSSWAYQPVRVPRFYLQGFDIISWAPSDSISDPRGCRPLGSKEEVEGLTGRELWKHRAIRSKSWKYIANWHQEKGANFQLFNLEKDPGEVENVISRYPDLTQHFVDILRRVDTSFPMPTESSVGPAYSEIDREIILARLQALGYA